MSRKEFEEAEGLGGEAQHFGGEAKRLARAQGPGAAARHVRNPGKGLRWRGDGSGSENVRDRSAQGVGIGVGGVDPDEGPHPKAAAGEEIGLQGFPWNGGQSAGIDAGCAKGGAHALLRAPDGDGELIAKAPFGRGEETLKNVMGNHVLAENLGGGQKPGLRGSEALLAGEPVDRGGEWHLKGEEKESESFHGWKSAEQTMERQGFWIVV